MFEVFTLVLAKNVAVQAGSKRITLRDVGEYARSNGCAVYIEALTDDFAPVPLRVRLLDSGKAEVWASDDASAIPSGPTFGLAFKVEWRARVKPGMYNLVLESNGKRLASHVVIVP